MRRIVLGGGVLFVAALSLGAAEKDTALAANTRTKKLQTKITVDFQDQFLKECFEEIKKQLEEARSGSLSVRYDTGVSMNQRVNFKAKDQTLEQVLEGMLKKNSLGYIVTSKAGDRYDGWLLIKQGNERGYAAGDEPKGDKTKAKGPPPPFSKSPDAGKGSAKEKPPTDDEKNEKTAASKLELARLLLKDGKTDKAKQRFEEIIRQYPKTKAAGEAQKELDKLK